MMHNGNMKIPRVIKFGIWVGGSNPINHQKDGWNPINNGMFTTYQLVQDFVTSDVLGARLSAEPTATGPSPS